MNPTKVMVNGIPGNMAVIVAQHILADNRFELVPYSLTGPEIEANEHTVDTISVRLFKPDVREQAIEEVVQKQGDFLSVEYSHPSAVNGNVTAFLAAARLSPSTPDCDLISFSRSQRR